jgi:hypothetical protein
MTGIQVTYRNPKRERMINDIRDAINGAEFNWKCSGIQTEHTSDLELEELMLDNPDSVVNEILAIVTGYIEEML